MFNLGPDKEGLRLGHCVHRTVGPSEEDLLDHLGVCGDRVLSLFDLLLSGPGSGSHTRSCHLCDLFVHGPWHVVGSLVEPTTKRRWWVRDVFQEDPCRGWT